MGSGSGSGVAVFGVLDLDLGLDFPLTSVEGCIMVISNGFIIVKFRKGAQKNKVDDKDKKKPPLRLEDYR